MLTNVETASQTFECRFTVTQQFMMSHEDMEKNEQGCYDPHRPAWAPPKLKFPTAMEFKQDILESAYQLRSFAGMMVMEHTTTVHAVFSEVLELRNFPFDC